MEELKKKIIEIFEANQSNLESYSYYGDAYGVSDEVYEDVAQLIVDEVKKLNSKE